MRHDLDALATPLLDGMADSEWQQGKATEWPTKPLSGGRRAYATLVSSDEYVVGLQVLLCQLSRVVAVPLPLYVLVDDTVASSATRLARAHAATSRLDVSFIRVSNPVRGSLAEKEVTAATYTKLHIWRLPPRSGRSCGLY